ncbi:MAG: HIT family protein [Candidatus Falkowbacteria bacterium]|nr:HIT family protein [Candidatus Falkowbacteria bacterium]
MCIFCQIINNKIPSFKVYENDKILAILDIQPVNAGHTIVMSKKHYPNIEEAGEDDLTAIILAIKKIGHLLKNKLGVAGYNVTANNDPVAGQIIPHLHFHVIPRREGDGLKLWPTFGYGPGEREKILKKLLS